MGDIQWRRVNDEPFEYAIQQGPHGDEFVKLLDGSSLRRPLEPQWVRDYEAKLMSNHGPSVMPPKLQ